MNSKLIVTIAAIAINLTMVAPGAQSADQGNQTSNPTTLPCGSRKPVGTAAMPRRWKVCRAPDAGKDSAGDRRANRNDAEENQEA